MATSSPSNAESESAGRLRPERDAGPATRWCPAPMAAEFAASRLTPLRRERLDALGAVPAELLPTVHDGRRIVVGGVVADRQCAEPTVRAAWLDLEDETGRVHVLCVDDVLARHRPYLETASALAVLGTLRKDGNRLDVLAERVTPLLIPGEPS